MGEQGAKLKLLSVMQAATRKRVDRHVILNAIRRGRIVAVRVGIRWIISDDAKFAAWEPDRTRQRAILLGLRRAKVRRRRAGTSA
jgi:hypothetical protein